MSETVKIERMLYGPAAVAHLDNGKTVFVEGAAPGDVADIQIIEDKKSFARAKAVEIAERGTSREGAPANVCMLCGGCPWAHLGYDTQLEAKRANLVDALVRTAHIDESRAESLVGETVASPEQWGYRNKIELAAFEDGAGKFQLGMHEAGSAQPVPVKRCPLANKKLEKLPKALAGVIRYLSGNASRDLGIYRVGARASMRTGKVEVALWTHPGKFPRSIAAKAVAEATGATGVVRVIADEGAARKVKSLEVLHGDAHWVENLKPVIPGCESSLKGGGTRVQYTVSAPSFFQVNTRQAERLVSLVLDAFSHDGGSPNALRDDAQCSPLAYEFAADVYCGVGTFSIPLALAGANVLAVEQEGSAVRDLRRNADRAGLDEDALEIVGDDAGIVLSELAEDAKDEAAEAQAESPKANAAEKACSGFVVVDPPRSGLGQGVCEAIAGSRPRMLAYVSCDPQTFARDAQLLETHGLRLVGATPVDMFPQTYHVETVGIFKGI